MLQTGKRKLLGLAGLMLVTALGHGQDYRTQYPLPTGATGFDGASVCVRTNTVNDSDLKAIAQSGFKWIRADIWWSKVEYKKGVYDFKAFDTIVNSAKANGLRAQLILASGNPLYTGDVNKLPAGTDQLKAYAAYVKACVQRYKEQGVLWEIQNEPDLSNLTPAQYLQLSSTAVSTIRSTSPNEWVMGPALSSLVMDKSATYMKQLLDGGVLNGLDAVSVHLYCNDAPETMGTAIQNLRASINAYSPNKTIPIFASEWGYPSDKLPITFAPNAYVEGGINLLKDSNNFSAASWKGWWSKPTITTGITDPSGAKKAFRMKSTDAGGKYSGIYQAGTLNKGEYYTASVWLRSTGATTRMYMGLNDGDKMGFMVDNTWRRYSYTFLVTDRYAQGRAFQVWEDTVANPDWEVYGAQVERIGTLSAAAITANQQQVQADFLVRAYKTSLAYNVPFISLYEWRDGETNGLLGMNKLDTTPKPARVAWDTYFQANKKP